MGAVHGQKVRVFAALLTGVAIYGLAMGTTYPLLGLLLAGRVGDVMNGLNVAATGLGLIAGVGLMPLLVGRLGAGVTVCLGVALMSLALFALAVAESYAALFTIRIALGLGANLMFVVTETGLNVLSAPETRGRLLSLYSMLTALGFVIGPALVAAAPDAPGLLLAGCAVVSVFTLVPFLVARPALDRGIEAPRGVAWSASIRAVPAAFAFLVLASAVDAVAIALLPVIGLKAGLSASEGALLVTSFHLGLIAGQPAVGWLLDRWGRRRAILACIFGCLAAAALLGAGGARDFAASAALLFVLGAANYGLYTAGLTLIGDRFQGAALSAATLSFALVYALASIVAPILFGIAMAGLDPLGLYGGLAVVYCAVLVWAVGRFRPMEPVLARSAGGIPFGSAGH